MKPFLLFLSLTCLPFVLSAKEHNFVAQNDVTWTALGTNENSSMPVGNGDIAANVWTEQNGDILLLLAKADAWSENGQMLKLGRVRVKLTPNPFTNGMAFTQTLDLEHGEIRLQTGKTTAHIWVDANHLVAHVEVQSDQRIQLAATSEIWRTRAYHLDQGAVGRAGFFEWASNPHGLDFEPDVILPVRNNTTSWCHYNTNSVYPLVLEREHLESLASKYPDPYLHHCFGATMKGPGLVSSGDQALKSAVAGKSWRLDLYALSEPADSAEVWCADLEKMVATNESVNIKKNRALHQKWWADFWNRSWVHVSGTPEAEKVSQGYAMQRYLTACAGRGAQPIKFNGSLFTVGHDLPDGASSSEKDHDPDFRAWGASYWNQNVRLVYWPLMASGDYDLLAPWFNMYVQALPLVKDRVQAYFHHDGAAFCETMYHWGLPNVHDFGWDNPGPQLQSEWQRYHIQGGLEVVAQMLERYDDTQDPDFARTNLLPVAEAVVTFYDQHWQRGPDGKILMSPSQSLETYQVDAVNPTADIAGLQSVLPRLRALPAGLATDTDRALWQKVLADLPAIPMGTTDRGKLPPLGVGDPDGKPTILPAYKYGKPKNGENPGLYTAFPYRIYGVGKPDLQLARDTYKARLFPQYKCWGQDGTMSAVLGLTEQAKKASVQEFTNYGNERFPWFWAKSNDWIPDMDNGGSGAITLQLMLMQCDGKRIQLAPAWPKNWTADFKLHAPFNTTVEGHVENGKVSDLKVTPKSRATDVVVVSLESTAK